MEIFCYVADQLKGVDNFECGNATVQTTGAIYNDFDCDPCELLGGIDEEPLYSQTTNLLGDQGGQKEPCLLYTSPSPRDS